MARELVMTGSSLGELRQAGAERQLLKARAATEDTLDAVKETSRVLREKIVEIRTRRSTGRPFTLDLTARLPRAVPLRTGRLPSVNSRSSSR